MAATRLIPLHVNKGKTIAQSLGDRTDYASNPEKTEKGELVSGYMCDPMTVDEEFLLSKRQYQQITGRESRHDVIAYQIRQSFKPGEITPEDANALGRELALRFTKGKYAFIVATHTDRAHIHNHIIFNSTSLDATRKFKNFWLSSIALQRISDLICLEHGLSVIKPKPYRDRQKRTEYPKKENLRDEICRDIDAVLQGACPNTFEELLQNLEKSGYEIKRGRQIAMKGKHQKRFIRLSSLREGYTEADLRAYLQSEGTCKRSPTQMKKHSRPDRPFNLIIDIQTKLQSKGAGYRRWATVYNLKQMSKTLLFLRDHRIESLDQLETMLHSRTEKRNEILSQIQKAEKRLTEISALRTHIINYSKTRSVYEAYRKAGYSKKFLEEHREEITLHKAAKQAFDTLELQKIPRIKELSKEYAEVLAEKKQLYHEYRKVKDEVQELLIAQKNVASLYDAERKEETQRQRQQEQSY